MSNAKVKESARRFADTIVRAFIDAGQHPMTRHSERLKLIEDLQPMARKEAEDDAIEDAKKKRAARLVEENAEVGSLINVSTERRDYLREYFDLNDESPEESNVDPTEVAKTVLDEVSETLKKYEWWEKCRNPVRHVVVNGQTKEGTMVRELTGTEKLWQEFLGYQQDNAWNNCQKAAALGGRLILFDWEQNKQYCGVVRRLRLMRGSFQIGSSEASIVTG